MITEIWINDIPIDLYSESKIKHTIQVNDIAEVRDRQSSFTNQFSVPKTSHNIRIMQGLGIASDTSDIPYQKPNCKMKYDGFDFIIKGWANISETEDDYKLHIYSGIITFFKAIENKTFEDLKELISEIDHKKNTSLIVESFQNSNLPYRYLIADYNGLTHFEINNQEVINSDPLIPGVFISFLWNKIHEKYGFSYTGNIFETEDFKETLFLYPKTTSLESSNEFYTITSTEISEIWDYNGSTLPEYGFVIFENQKANTSPLFPMTKYPLREFRGRIYDNYGYFKAAKSGTYRFEYDATNYPNFGDFELFIAVGVNENISPREAYQYKRHSAFLMFSHMDGVKTKSAVKGEFVTQINEGEWFCIGFRHLKTSAIRSDGNLTLTINKLANDFIEFTDQLKQYSLTEFIKEVINRFGLTIFPSEFSNVIEYKTLTERINSEVIDWSEKFVQRLSESYIYNNYAQSNEFSYQHNDKESKLNHGEIFIRNVNLNEKTEVFQSKTYSPDNNSVEFKIGDKICLVPILRYFDKEIKEKKDGTTEIIYKPLDKRFHLLTSKQIQNYAVLSSKIADNGDSFSTNKIYIADFNLSSWNYLLGKFYSDFQRIISSSRIQRIELNLNIADIIHLDLSKLYYFKQEQQYYLLNKLQFEEDKAVGEFIRVKKTDLPPTPSLFINITWEDGTTSDKLITDNYVTIKIESSNFGAFSPIPQISTDGINFIDATYTLIETGFTSPPNYRVTILSGVNYLRLKNENTPSNILKATK